MKSIKEILIHLLGGYTKDDRYVLMRKCVNQSYARGYRTAFFKTKCFMESLNGLYADKWCKKAYEFIEKKLKDIE